MGFLLLLSLVVTMPQSSTAESETRYSFTLKNDSNCPVYELYLGQSYKKYWGMDFLAGKRIIKAGESFKFSAVMGEYDIKLVSKTGKECIFNKFKLTGDKTWSLTNAWLNKCAGWKCGS